MGFESNIRDLLQDETDDKLHLYSNFFIEANYLDGYNILKFESDGNDSLIRKALSILKKKGYDVNRRGRQIYIF